MIAVPGESGAWYCARHAKEVTRLRCGRCEKPICTRCAVYGPAGARCRDCAHNHVPIRRRIELSWRGPYRKLWLLIGSLIVAVGIGYAIGTKVAVNALFNTWLIVWFFPAGIIPMFQYRNFRQYGAMPAFVTMVTYMLLLFVLGGMVFGNPCPYVHLPQFGTPGAR